MENRGNIDPTLRVLKPLGRYQILQLLANVMGSVSWGMQLLVNIFIGREVTWQRCAAPDNNSVIADQLQHVDWNSSNVVYGQCEITVSKDNHSDDFQQFPCVFGYEYGYPKELSYKTDFDLVCDWKLLGGLAQSFVLMGQGVGAVVSSVLSDRYGRKTIMSTAQLGLFLLGVAVGFSPSYPLLLCGKFLCGALQQGIMTASVTLGVEWLPSEHRSIRSLLGALFWSMGASLMALFAYLLRNYPWSYLQIAVSCVSAPVALFYFCYLDESLRWLVVNGKEEAAVRVLQRAARVNGKDFQTVLQVFQSSTGGEAQEDATGLGDDEEQTRQTLSQTANNTVVNQTPEDRKHSENMTLLDLVRSRRLLINACITCLAWCIGYFSYIAQYMMSTSLHGDPYINFFLTALMEFVPVVLLYFTIDRFGRNSTFRVSYFWTGSALLISGVCRIFTDNSVLAILSVVAALLGTVGASAITVVHIVYSPELYPTNIRTQTLGLCSLAGRLGGMLAPFMLDLADVAVWAPGVVISSLCFLVVITGHVLPETKGRPLPTTIHDVEQWYRKDTDTHSVHQSPRPAHSKMSLDHENKI